MSTMLMDSMGVKALSIEDIKKAMGLSKTLPVLVNFRAKWAAAGTGVMQLILPVDLSLAEADYAPVITGIQCQYHGNGGLFTPNLGAAGDVHIHGRITVWDDEPYSDSSFYYDNDVKAGGTIFDLATVNASRSLAQWPIQIHQVQSAAGVTSFSLIQIPDGRPVIIPEYAVKDGKIHITIEGYKDVATSVDNEFWGTLILWVYWVPQSQAEFNRMLIGELSKR